MKYQNIKRMGWKHEDIARALRYKNVKSFRSSAVHQEQMELLDELVGKSFEKGVIIPSEKLREVFDDVIREVEKGEVGRGEFG